MWGEAGTKRQAPGDERISGSVQGVRELDGVRAGSDPCSQDDVGLEGVDTADCGACGRWHDRWYRFRSTAPPPGQYRLRLRIAEPACVPSFSAAPLGEPSRMFSAMLARSIEIRLIRNSGESKTRGERGEHERTTEADDSHLCRSVHAADLESFQFGTRNGALSSTRGNPGETPLGRDNIGSAET